MKIWIDDIRKPPTDEYWWCRSVNQTITLVRQALTGVYGDDVRVEEMNFDHDAGKFRDDGGDFIKVMDWMEEHHIVTKVVIHTGNPVGKKNMVRICEHNGWEYAIDNPFNKRYDIDM